MKSNFTWLSIEWKASHSPFVNFCIMLDIDRKLIPPFSKMPLFGVKSERSWCHLCWCSFHIRLNDNSSQLIFYQNGWNAIRFTEHKTKAVSLKVSSGRRATSQLTKSNCKKKKMIRWATFTGFFWHQFNQRLGINNSKWISDFLTLVFQTTPARHEARLGKNWIIDIVPFGFWFRVTKVCSPTKKHYWWLLLVKNVI